MKFVRVVFRCRRECEIEEAIAEAVGSAFDSYVRLRTKGKDPFFETGVQLAQNRCVSSRRFSREGLIWGRQRSASYGAAEISGARK